MKSISKTFKILTFILFYVKKLVQSNLFIAYDIITPIMYTKPGFVWIELKLDTKFGLLLFSNLLSMTPGTLSIDISETKNKLLVHYLYRKDKNEAIKQIEEIQNRVINLLN